MRKVGVNLIELPCPLLNVLTHGVTHQINIRIKPFYLRPSLSAVYKQIT